jgi:predicted nucleic acid-binding protein
VASLVDTNILVYRVDPRQRQKREMARRILNEGLAHESLRIPHQALVEFVSAVTRPLADGSTLLPREEAWREVEELLAAFTILYPNDSVVRTALRGMAAYQLPWYDAHLWAYAECNGLPEILSEDFQHGRMYGSVRVMNPFLRRAG